jgi:hypothetical protein
MFSAQALDFLRHRGKVLERTYRLVGIPVSNEKRKHPYWQDTRESNRVLEFQPAAKSLENSLDPSYMPDCSLSELLSHGHP